jgi:putative transposase
VQSTNVPILACPGVREHDMRNLTLPSRAQRQLSRLHLAELSREARCRLQWFDWHAGHGRNVSLTCRHFGIARETFYRWLRRYKPSDLRTLEDRLSKPKRCRQREWTTAQVLAVQRLREQYVRWGKEKLRVLLERAGITLSASTIGRILAYLKRTGKLREPVRRSLSQRRQWKRQYATRMPKGYVVSAPGDLVQLDTTEIKPEPGVVLKQFTTVDVLSRWSVPTVASNATATLATRALEALIARSPFPIRAIQVDGGSEFMAGFEDACQQKGIRLFELPPRSPKLNGRVERANRTYKDEFYDCSTASPTVAGFAADLRRWEDVYNTVRPHQALGYLTPQQFLDTWNANHPEEVLSRTS